MFRDIEGVVRPDSRSVRLKHKKGDATVLERRLAYLALEGRVVTTTDGFYFESETRPAKGMPPVSGMLEESAIEEHDGPPVFTVTKSSPHPSITANVTSDDNLYWFKDQATLILFR